MPPCHVFGYISANTHMNALKELDFSQFGKGQYAFYPIMLLVLPKRNEVRQNYGNFIRGDPYDLGWTPL